MKYLIIIIILSLNLHAKTVETYSLTVTVDLLRNSIGEVQFALYNKDDSIPDEKYKNYYKIKNAAIINTSSTVKFNNLPQGNYAINILHDENKDGKIEKGFFLPKEGIGLRYL